MDPRMQQWRSRIVHIDIYLPGDSWCFPVRWEPLKQDVAQIWSKLGTKVTTKVSQNGSQVDKIAFSSLDGKIRVADEDEFAAFIERALETQSQASSFVIQLRAIVSQVCLFHCKTRHLCVCFSLCLLSVHLLASLLVLHCTTLFLLVCPILFASKQLESPCTSMS